MQTLFDFINTYRGLIIGLVVAFSLILSATYPKGRLWWRSVWFTFPVIGRNARHAKHFELDKQGWFNTEKDMCQHFYNSYTQHQTDQRYFSDCNLYLEYAGDQGTTKKRFLLYVFAIAIALFEAYFLASVLAEFVMVDPSESSRHWMSVATGIVFTLILGFLTHNAGKEIRENLEYRKTLRCWQQDSEKNTAFAPTPYQNISLKSQANHLDKDMPKWQKSINRMKRTQESWWSTGLALMIIIVIAVGATFVRVKSLDNHLLSQPKHTDIFDSNLVSNPFASNDMAIIDDIETSQQNQKLAEDAFRDGSVVTYILFNLMFIGIQFMHTFIAFSTSLIGKESAAAYNNTHRFNNVEDYLSQHERERNYVANLAQKVLNDLQRKLTRNAFKHNVSDKVSNSLERNEQRTFLDFVDQHYFNQDNAVHDVQHRFGKKALNEELNLKPNTQFELPIELNTQKC
jgi:hypothetical protein